MSAVAAGGVYRYKDGRTAPDTINVCSNIRANSPRPSTPRSPPASGHWHGTVRHGRPADVDTKIRIPPRRQECEAGDHRRERRFHADHVNNFLDCVRSRKLPNADVLIGHRSAQASHLGNIAYVQKRRLKFDTVREEILPL